MSDIPPLLPVPGYHPGHPDGVVVNLGCGLDTRYHRLRDSTLANASRR